MLFVFFLSGCGAESSLRSTHWFDRSHAVFFPAKIREQLDTVQSFPLFWWNFLVLDAGTTEIENGKVEAVCRAWRTRARELEATNAHGHRVLGKLACGADLSSFRETVADWARDDVFRRRYPGRRERERLESETLVQASLPVGADVLGLLRVDPFGTYRELRKLLEERIPIELPRQSSFFVDAPNHRVIIPIQFAYPPEETSKTGALLDAARIAGIPFTLIGPHSATYGNEREVMSDVRKVSVAGVILTALQLIVLIALRRTRALLLFPVVAVATAVGAIGTILTFGSIHGLTLAFGTGMAGMAIDYGLHSVFNTGYRGVWRANFCGLVTTLVGFVILTQSSVPLLRQLMVFSIVGITVGYLVFYFLHRRYPTFFAVEPFNYIPAAGRARLVVVGIALAGAGAGLFVLRPDFRLSQFDFIDAHSAEVRNSLYAHLRSRNALFLPENADAQVRSRAQAIQAWSKSSGIPVENVARYLPDEATSRGNLESWTTGLCGEFSPLPSTPVARFFSPYLERVNCASLRELAGRGTVETAVPAYLRDFTDGKKFISIFLPTDADGVARVKVDYPTALSIREMVDVFPRELETELRWMGPLAVALASFFLFLYYRRASRALVALVPFGCALGVYSLAALAFHLDVSFMTLIALLMVFGFSIDYGVFAVDVVTDPTDRSVRGVWSCLLFSGIATTLGFVPLLFCRHPVMAHLGQALVFGTIGTHLGTLWGVPGILSLVRPGKVRA